jgi:hypothetical protein
VKRIHFVILLAIASQADAQTLYICATSAGHSYQQAPCAPTARLLKTIDTQPEPQPTAEQRRERAEKAVEDRAESAFLSRMAGTDGVHANTRSVLASRNGRRQSTLTQAIDACSQARATRTSTRRAMGLNRTFDALSALDRAVADACNGGHD